MQTARSWLRARSKRGGKGASGRACPVTPRSDAPKVTQVRAVTPIGGDEGLWSRFVFNIGRRARVQPQARALPETIWPDWPKGTKVTAVIFPIVVAGDGHGRCQRCRVAMGGGRGNRSCARGCRGRGCSGFVLRVGPVIWPDHLLHCMICLDYHVRARGCCARLAERLPLPDVVRSGRRPNRASRASRP